MSALILSVGDKPVSAKTLELSLEQHGYRTTLAQTAKEAAEYSDMPRHLPDHHRRYEAGHGRVGVPPNHQRASEDQCVYARADPWHTDRSPLSCVKEIIL